MSDVLSLVVIKLREDERAFFFSWNPVALDMFWFFFCFKTKHNYRACNIQFFRVERVVIVLEWFHANALSRYDNQINHENVRQTNQCKQMSKS